MSATPTTNDNHTNNQPLRVIFFGMTGAFSRAPLLALLRASDTPSSPDAPPIEVCAVVLPTLAGVATPRMLRADVGDPHPPYVRLDRQAGIGKPRRAPMPMLSMAAPNATANPSPRANRRAPGVNAQPGAPPDQNILEIASAHGIPIFEVARLNDPQTLAALVEFVPDVICVACFSRRLPPALLRLPRLGCLNVHPSLLPANRGPDPLFWTFHEDDSITGVTIHLMDEGLDTGPIVLQQMVAVAEGIGESALEAQLAWLGGELLAQAVAGLASGALQPQPQDDTRATTHGWPTEDDYTITAADWPAERAYRFACGVGGRATSITLVAADGARFILVEAHSYQDDTSGGVHTSDIDEPWSLSVDYLTLRCNPGVLYAQAIPDDGEEEW